MNHRQKQRLARKKLTREEIVNGTPIFQSEYWENRKLNIINKVNQTIINRRAHKIK